MKNQDEVIRNFERVLNMRKVRTFFSAPRYPDVYINRKLTGIVWTSYGIDNIFRQFCVIQVQRNDISAFRILTFGHWASGIWDIHILFFDIWVSSIRGFEFGSLTCICILVSNLLNIYLWHSLSQKPSNVSFSV